MTPCGRPECRICGPRPPAPERESLASLLVGGAVLVLWFVLLIVLLPVLAS